MEAMYFTGKEFIGSNLPQCIQRRASRSGWSARELWYGYDMMASEVHVRIRFVEEDTARMLIRFIEQNRIIRERLFSGTSGTENRGALREYILANFSYHSGDRIATFHTKHNTEIRRYFDHSLFIDPTVKTDVRGIEGNYLNVLKLSEVDSSNLVKRIAEIYDTQPDWEFLPHPDFSPDTPSRFAILEGKRRLFLDNFGDGLHYGLAIMSIAKTRNNTALFIEEIESHQHPAAIRNLVSNLLDIARMNNLQLFITTHNQSVWNYLYYYYGNPEERKKEFRCFHVIRDKDSGEVEARIEEGIVNIQPDLNGTPQ